MPDFKKPEVILLKLKNQKISERKELKRKRLGQVIYQLISHHKC